MTTQTDTPGSVTAVYQVTGMSCGHCEGAVSGEISEIDGVSSVKAVAATGEVTVVSSAAARRGRRPRRGGRGGLRARRPGLSPSPQRGAEPTIDRPRHSGADE